MTNIDAVICPMTRDTLEPMLTDVGVLADIFSSVLSLFLGKEQASWSLTSPSVQEIVSPVLT